MQTEAQNSGKELTAKEQQRTYQMTVSFYLLTWKLPFMNTHSLTQ